MCLSSVAEGGDGATGLILARRIPNARMTSPDTISSESFFIHNSEGNFTFFPISWGRRDPTLATFLSHLSSSKV